MYQATAWSVILYVVRGPRKEHLQQKLTQTISLKYPLFTAEIGKVKGSTVVNQNIPTSSAQFKEAICTIWFTTMEGEMVEKILKVSGLFGTTRTLNNYYFSIFLQVLGPFDTSIRS